MSTLTQDRPFVRAVGDEPLPGYRLVAPLGQGGFGEVWKCLAPGGLQKAVKFVYEDEKAGGDSTTLRQEHEGFERVKGIRHPFLLTLERVELIGGELIMVMELADKNLTNRYQECRDDGLPGIPRDELLSYMVDTAEALDVLSRQHGLQHLDVKPANLFLLGGHVKVGDYGLVSRYQRTTSVPDKGDQKLGRGLTPKYVAPEILRGHIDARSDQYPLALVYQELLTGTFPYNGKTARQLLNQHAATEPDVSPLPTADRITVRRALAKDPEARFSTCLAFVKALLRDPASTSLTPSPSTTISASQTTRTLPAMTVRPTGEAALITPSFGVVENVNITQRNHQTITVRPTTMTGPLTGAADDLTRACPGYIFLSEVDCGPRGRVVRAADPAGRPHRIQIVRLDGSSPTDYEPVLALLAKTPPEVLQRVTLPHQRTAVFILPDDAPGLSVAPGKNGNVGTVLRREELVERLSTVAGILDRLHRELGFAHGLLTPQAVISYEAKPGREATGLTGYGVAELLRKTRDDLDWIASEPYAAPEAIRGHVLPASDQYSLALLFLEQVKAWSPASRRPGRNDRTMPIPQVDFSGLQTHERAAIRRAMSVRPADRFETCHEFAEALRAIPTGRPTLDEVLPLVSIATLTGKSESASTLPEPESWVETLVRTVMTTAGSTAAGKNGVLHQADGKYLLRFPARLTADLTKLKLESFKNQWRYELNEWTKETYALRPKQTGTNPTMAKPFGVELVVQFPANSQSASTHATAGEVNVTGRYVGHDSSGQATEQIITMLENFRRALQNTDERRRAPRVKAELPVALYPIDDELSVHPVVLAKTRDLSLTGLGLVLTTELSATHFYITFPTIRDLAGHAILAQTVRSHTNSNGHPHLGVKFVHAG